MKEKDIKESTRELHEVNILYAASPTQCMKSFHFPHQLDVPNIQNIRIGKGSLIRERTTIMRWKSVDRKTNIDTTASKFAHRITSIEHHSRATSCLFKHLLSGV